MNGKEIEGREIAVKVAIDSPGKEDDAPAEASTEGAATTEAAPATTEATEKPAETPAATTTAA